MSLSFFDSHQVFPDDTVNRHFITLLFLTTTG